jgi:hypothetical protein
MMMMMKTARVQRFSIWMRSTTHASGTFPLFHVLLTSCRAFSQKVKLIILSRHQETTLIGSEQVKNKAICEVKMIRGFISQFRISSDLLA